jgi:hypothetical protein
MNLSRQIDNLATKLQTVSLSKAPNIKQTSSKPGVH